MSTTPPREAADRHAPGPWNPKLAAAILFGASSVPLTACVLTAVLTDSDGWDSVAAILASLTLTMILLGAREFATHLKTRH